MIPFCSMQTLTVAAVTLGLLSKRIEKKEEINYYAVTLLCVVSMSRVVAWSQTQISKFDILGETWPHLTEIKHLCHTVCGIWWLMVHTAASAE